MILEAHCSCITVGIGWAAFSGLIALVKNRSASAHPLKSRKRGPHSDMFDLQGKWSSAVDELRIDPFLDAGHPARTLVNRSKFHHSMELGCRALRRESTTTETHDRSPWCERPGSRHLHRGSKTRQRATKPITTTALPIHIVWIVADLATRSRS